jgi:hypothetical protein
MGPFKGKLFRHGGTDPARCAGDKGNTPSQTL